MLTIAYVRVSTEDQSGYSPEAQRKRCLAHAQSNNLGSVTFLSDEGLSGKNLERPAIQRLIAHVEADEVAAVIVWRLDRLSRDSGDLSRLVRLFEKHCMALHSVNEGAVQVSTAAGRMQVGMHGVFAQYYREHVVENVKLGQTEAIQKGRWLNRAPTGYRMVNGELVPDEMAPLIPRVFELRALGMSYPEIEAKTGIKYSTVRQICANRAYLGQTRKRDDWFPAIHEPLVDQDLFDRAQRGNPTGKRIGSDLLSGRVKCSECGKRIAIEYSGRSIGLYRCRNRGEGCAVPGRQADGLARAARLALRELSHDDQLQSAIRAQLGPRSGGAQPAKPSRSGALVTLKRRREKLMELYFADKISMDLFSKQEQELTAQIAALEAEAHEAGTARERQSVLVDHFERVATQLRQMDVDAIWEEASDTEKRTLVNELVEAVIVHPDRLQVAINGAPLLTVDFEEVGLRSAGMRNSVSKGGLEHMPSPCRTVSACPDHACSVALSEGHGRAFISSSTGLL